MHRQLCSLQFLLLLLVVVRPQPFPYISIGGVTLPSHAFVELSDVGSTVDTGLQCHTDLSTCCSGAQGIHRGDWYFPDGNRLPFPPGPEGVSEIRGPQQVGLRHVPSESDVVSGIYYCEIPTTIDDPSTREVVYVGIYNTAGGT